jgi:hypothetical protein
MGWGTAVAEPGGDETEAEATARSDAILLVERFDFDLKKKDDDNNQFMLEFSLAPAERARFPPRQRAPSARE